MTEVEKLSDRQRAYQALDLRAAGLTWEQIAERLSYHDRASAWNAVDNLRQKGAASTTSDQRFVEDHRLGRLWSVYYRQALTGDQKSARLALEISKQRVALNGLNLNEARMAGALEVSAMADVAAISHWHSSLLVAMTKAGVDPVQQAAVIDELNRTVATAMPRGEGDGDDQ